MAAEQKAQPAGADAPSVAILGGVITFFGATESNGRAVEQISP
jgi:hypothetical protein